MYELMWFLSGALLYLVLSKLIYVSQAVVFFRDIQLHSLWLLKRLQDDITFMREIKYEVMEDCKLPPDQIKHIKAIDSEVLTFWKESIIMKFKDSLPLKYKGIVSFNSWDEAMKLFKENNERN